MLAYLFTALLSADTWSAKCATLAIAVSLADRELAAVAQREPTTRRLFSIVAVMTYPGNAIATWARVIFSVPCVNWWAVLPAGGEGTPFKRRTQSVS